MTVIARGAEAVIERTQDGIRKVRPQKAYRHPHIDKELRTQRTRAEARILEKARELGVTVPRARVVNDHTLALGIAPGVPFKETLDADPALLRTVGEMLARLHAGGIVHGDLTTSNIMHDAVSNTITLIDFGLAYHTGRIEDKAVDIHVLKQALASKHHRVATKAFREFCAGYRSADPQSAEEILARLRAVERRGRNKVT